MKGTFLLFSIRDDGGKDGVWSALRSQMLETFEDELLAMLKFPP
jgi:hypothetical protein